uniref:Uncharacterized protein n=1 Tax=Pseudo-nitzschia australis TaxID=44445 RepID=A0A7S4ELG1_9STRA|mmetsp:Transcript_3040/g.6106  ORF Transcript_3040/g.6106 Transcript_3040/m.6106 type:complete len:155 (+) Transcript_3040:329-793(+)
MDVDSGRDGIDGFSEMDSHANTTAAAGSNMVMLDDPDDVMHFVDISPFLDDYAPIKKVPIAQCATAWTDPESGVVWILVFDEALYFGDKVRNSLINPNQIRSHAFNKVDDTPRQFDPNSNHGITFVSDVDDKTLFIPLHMDGVISYFALMSAIM